MESLIVAEKVAEHFALESAIGVFKKRRAIAYKLFFPNASIRVVISAFIRIRFGSRFLLVRNLHRPHTFGPFGGVVKYHLSAIPMLDALSFFPEDFGPGGDMKHDLRGILPRKNFFRWQTWAYSGRNRESATECLNRELREELLEIKLGRVRVPIGNIQYQMIRCVEEGPERVTNLPYRQYRLFEIYDFLPTKQKAWDFLDKTERYAQKHRDLLLADADEITRGISNDGRSISPPSMYLIGERKRRRERHTRPVNSFL